jgi:hypothetical protein
MDDPYRTLGLPFGAPHDAVRRAYRREARRYHPDLNPDPAAPAQMTRINAAYERLEQLEEIRQRQDESRAPRRRKRDEKRLRCRHEYETLSDTPLNLTGSVRHTRARCLHCGLEREILDDYAGWGYRVKWRAPGESQWRERKYQRWRAKQEPAEGAATPSPTPAWQELKMSCAATGMAIGGVLGFLFLLAGIASATSGDAGGLGAGAFSFVAFPGIGYWPGDRVGALLTIGVRRQEERRSQ